MFKNKTVKRFRAVAAAVVITLSVNYAVSIVANAHPQSDTAGASIARSGSTLQPGGPKP